MVLTLKVIDHVEVIIRREQTEQIIKEHRNKPLLLNKLYLIINQRRNSNNKSTQLLYHHRIVEVYLNVIVILERERTENLNML